ncbi:WD40 repeat domain-containing protein [Calycomorphotria hydatis]|nr:WD40 repeat domain-containing protein [Calycomorphotria hydatis]
MQPNPHIDPVACAPGYCFSRVIAALLVFVFGVSPVFAGEIPVPKMVTVVKDLEEWATSVAFSPDGKQLAVGTYDVVEIYDTESWEPKETLKTRGGYARALAWHDDTLYVADYQTITVWNAATGKRLAKLRGHRGYVTGLALSDEYLYSASLDGTVRKWNLDDRKGEVLYENAEQPIQGLALSQNGEMLAIAWGDETQVTQPGGVALLDAESGELTKQLEQHGRVALSVMFFVDDTRLASTSEDEKIVLHDVGEQKTLFKFDGHSRPTNDIVVTSGGKIAISCSGGRAVGKNEILIWNVETGEEYLKFEGSDEKIVALSVSPDETLLAAASYDKRVVVWDISESVSALTFSLRPPVEAPRPELPRGER